MKIYAQDVIKVAEAELGYHEKASNKNLDDKTANAGSANWQKYGRDLNKAGYYNGNKNGYEWCDQFVDWCFYMACGKDKKTAEAMQCQTGNLGAGTGYSMGYYKAQGRLDMVPKVGDQLFFRYSGTTGCDHTGLVVDVTDKQITTIEGNSNNQVRKRTYSRNEKSIIGYGHPKYDEVPPLKTVNVVLTQLEKGCQGTEVKVLQTLLKMYGYKDQTGAVLKLDGDFGNKTKFALMAYQVGHKLTGDGVCGAKTWSMLLKGV